MGSCAAFLAVSCVNPEYDLENIQIDQVHALDNISLPIGHTRKIVLSELIENEGFGDVLKLRDNGDYYFNLFSGDKSVSVEIPDFYFEGFYENLPNQTISDYPVIIPSLIPGVKLGPVAFSKITYDLEMDQSGLPEMVSDIEYADVKTDMIVKFEYDQSRFPFKKIYLEKGLKIRFPKWLIPGNVPEPFVQINDHELQAESPLVITPSDTEVIIPLDAIDFTKMPEGQGFIGNGRILINDVIELSGETYLMSDDCTSTGEYYPILTTYMHMSAMELESVRTKINLAEVALIESSFELDDIAEVLENEDYVLDLDGLKLDLGIESSLPFAVDFHAAAQTYVDDSEEPLWDDNFDILDIPAGTEDSPSVSSYSISFDDFPLYPIPSRVDFSILPLVSDNAAIDLYPGSTYDVSVDYSLTCDGFGKDFRLGINEDLTGLGLEIHEVDVAEVQLKFTLVNALPFDFQISAQAIDAEGNLLDDITAELDGDINGGSVGNPAVNKLTLKLINKGDLVLDGVRLSMSANVSGERAVLNKDQYVQITDISISLPQGITYYINENI